MSKTVRITTGNKIEDIDITWSMNAQEEAIGCGCSEIVRARGLVEMFLDDVPNGRVVMLVDESGIVKHRETNRAASDLYGFQEHGFAIAGDVIIGILRGPDFVPLDDMAETEKDRLMKKYTFLQEA